MTHIGASRPPWQQAQDRAAACLAALQDRFEVALCVARALPPLLVVVLAAWGFMAPRAWVGERRSSPTVKEA